MAKFKNGVEIAEVILFERILRDLFKYEIGNVDKFTFKGNMVKRVLVENDEQFVISTSKGNLQMTSNDLLIIDAKGEFHVCNYYYFSDTYKKGKEAKFIRLVEEFRKKKDKLMEKLNDAPKTTDWDGKSLDTYTSIYQQRDEIFKAFDSLDDRLFYFWV